MYLCNAYVFIVILYVLMFLLYFIVFLMINVSPREIENTTSNRCCHH